MDFLKDMVRPKKHLGQHFLKNAEIAHSIAISLTGKGYDLLVEVGPGMGVLTQYLSGAGKDLYVVEIDGESVNYLHQNFHLRYDHIIEGDFLKLQLKEVFKKQLAVVGNFPYNISSQIVFKVLENRDLVPEMVGMFQKEVAERLVANPGSKTYGILSVLASAFYEREYLFTVDAFEFNPPPKVQSGVIRFIRKKDYSLDCDEKLFTTVVKTAFNQRRKTLRNALKPLNLSAKLGQEELFSKRAEQLGLEDFIYITNRMADHEL